jgi:hypothetical protein
VNYIYFFSLDTQLGFSYKRCDVVALKRLSHGIDLAFDDMHGQF